MTPAAFDPATLDVASPEHYERNGYPHPEWTWLRKHAPIFWYDRENVGFEWRQSAPESVVYATASAGNGNGGHDMTGYLGLDWSREPERLEELLEYLKTL